MHGTGFKKKLMGNFMIPLLDLIVLLLVGVLLGTFYFVGLWWTVGRLSRSARPASLYLLSFGFRMALLLLAFSILLNVGVIEFFAALAGFIATRLVLVRWLGWSEFGKAKSCSGLPGANSSTTGSS